jgi:hypothetical protein
VHNREGRVAVTVFLRRSRHRSASVASETGQYRVRNDHVKSKACLDSSAQLPASEL